LRRPGSPNQRIVFELIVLIEKPRRAEHSISDRQMFNDRILARALGVVALLALAASAFAQSGEHGDGHAGMHDIYKNWHTPMNSRVSCCNNADCRPTRAYVDEDGNWHAWNGSNWLLVPDERLLPTDYAGDGRSHLCEQGGFIYCFTPGEVRS
jgi:hypothetical protein